MPKFIDRIGQRFGRVLVLARAPSSTVRTMYVCRCDCGNECVIEAYNLHTGHTQSCGCFHSEVCSAMAPLRRTHGHSRQNKGKASRTYNTWKQMRERCHNPNTQAFYYYGRKGISVTKPWRDSFASFLNDMGERPPGKTLDRIDNRFGYFMANCRWSTPKQQANNRRNPRRFVE